MKEKFLLLTTLSIVLIACSNQHEVKNSNAEVSQSEIEETPLTIAVEYEEPKAWIKTTNHGLTKYTAPEGDAFLAFVSISSSSNAEDAAKQAWKQIDSEFSRDIQFNTPNLAAKGWDMIRRIEFVTSMAEEYDVKAYVHQINNQKANQKQSRTVLLLGGKYATIGKREAAVIAMIKSFKVAGYKAENFSNKTPNKITEESISKLIEFVKESASTLDIPGIGFGLVQNGKIIYAGGVGVKKLGSEEAVDKDTLFMIASNTKSMTTLLLSKLVELGKINWGDKVVKYYPEFKLGDLATTQSVLIRHLVCACTGLPRKDFDWIFSSHPDASVTMTFDDLAKTTPTSGFGEVYQYNNQMAAAAGYIAGHVFYPQLEMGEAYDKAIQEYIFTPLQMGSSSFSFEQVLNGNFANPHAFNGLGENQIVSQTPSTGFNQLVVPYRPAGGAWSSVSDMLKFVNNELSQGINLKGERVFAAEPLIERRKPIVADGADSMYGMGLTSKQISGVKIIEHGGSLAGYQSNFIALPDANVGAVILTNSDQGNWLIEPFTRRIIELLYEGKEKAYQQVKDRAETAQSFISSMQNEVTYPAEPKVVDRLAKNYFHEVLGNLKVTKKNGEVILDPGVWKSNVATKTNPDKSVSLVLLSPGVAGLEFIVGNNDGKRTLSLMDAQHTYMFTEIPEA